MNRPPSFLSACLPAFVQRARSQLHLLTRRFLPSKEAAVRKKTFRAWVTSLSEIGISSKQHKMPPFPAPSSHKVLEGLSSPKADMESKAQAGCRLDKAD